MAITYVVLNGPPRTGKSTIAKELAQMLAAKSPGPGAVITDSFASPMKHLIATSLGQRYQDLAKDSPDAVLQGYSPREFLIDMSEHYLKPRYGDDFFGRLLVHRSLRYNPLPKFVVCDDGGFAEELAALPNPVLVQVHRPGFDFTNDSRSYLPDPNWKIVNGTTIDELWITVRKLAFEILTEADIEKPL